MNKDLRSPARLVIDSVLNSNEAPSTNGFSVERFIDDLVSFSPQDLAELFVETSLEKVRASQVSEKSRAALLAKLSLTLVSYLEIEEPETLREVLRAIVSKMNAYITEIGIGSIAFQPSRSNGFRRITRRYGDAESSFKEAKVAAEKAENAARIARHQSGDL